MRILVTGSAGRVGRAIHVRLMREHDVAGLDRTPASTARWVGDIRDEDLRRRALAGIDVVVHTAALHAPHVGLLREGDFVAINVEATEQLFREALEAGASHFVFTSTTALYGHASTPVGIAGWVDENVEPQPRTIYHRSKIEAEHRLERLAVESEIPLTVLQMSRCFPEGADLMAAYLLHRGVDARDVAQAHALAIERRPPGFRRFIVSAATPFERSDCEDLYGQAPVVLEKRAPNLVAEFERRGWSLPAAIDRVYDATAAREELGWRSRHGWRGVLAMLDDESSEVLPVVNR